MASPRPGKIDTLAPLHLQSNYAVFICHRPDAQTQGAKPRVLVSLTKCTDAEGGLADFGPLRDIVRSFEDADHGTVVHHNLSLGITVLSVNLGSSAGCAKDLPRC